MPTRSRFIDSWISARASRPLAERERVRHHLIDVVKPDQEFNAAMFRHLASEVIYQIDERKRNPMVCGGTGLYLKALTRGLFEGPAQDVIFRSELEKEIAQSGLAFGLPAAGRDRSDGNIDNSSQRSLAHSSCSGGLSTDRQTD